MSDQIPLTARRRPLTTVLYAALLTSVIGASPQLLAQTDTTQNDQDAQDEERAEDAPFELEELIVTARRIEELAPTVPLTIRVIDEEEIKRLGVRDIEDVTRLTPGLTFDLGGFPNDTRPAVRGMQSERGRPSVAVMLDGLDLSGENLAIAGGSNGGLLVGATMTQRPDLAKVAFPAVGVLDMLRYHKFTAGAGWIYDYGCADSSQAMFEYMHNYSPVHNVKVGTNYPATLVKTADHDDRVVPAHSFKFISELQAKDGGENPVLIRIDKKAGHGAGKPTSMVIDEWADTYAFVYYHLEEEPFESVQVVK